jgi:acetyltransferase-like isoleucine patch superfamily enzyme
MTDFRRCGKDVTIYSRARVLGRDHVAVGAHVIIDDFVFIGLHEDMVLGNYVHIAAHASITGGGRCTVADFSGISSGARILTGTDDFAGTSLTGPTVPAEFRRVVRGEVVIESHVVVGANAVVLPNVRLGEGATIGAGSVVTRDLEPWGVYAGVPARRIRERLRDGVLQAEKALYAKYGCPRPSYRRPPVVAP